MAPDPDIELRRMIGSYLRPCAAPAPLWSNQGQARGQDDEPDSSSAATDPATGNRTH
jgi:hypothetical protein